MTRPSIVLALALAAAPLAARADAQLISVVFPDGSPSAAVQPGGSGAFDVVFTSSSTALTAITGLFDASGNHLGAGLQGGSIHVAPVPEPTTLALATAAVLTSAVWRRRNASAKYC